MSHSTSTIASLAIAFLLFVAPVALAQDANKEIWSKKVANAYGFENWGQVEEIRYTFNTLKNEKHNARVWVWRPIDREVTLVAWEGSDMELPITYSLDDINEDASETLRKVDHRFINDSYWLLYPFQLVWSSPDIFDKGTVSLPIGDGKAHKLVTQYPDEGGYTPGDAYDIYLDENNLILQWDFRKGGKVHGWPTTWENNVDLGPIKVCTDHYDKERNFRLWFDGLGVTTTDGKTYE